MKILWLSFFLFSLGSGCSHFYEVRSVSLEDEQIALEGETGTHGESLYKEQFAAKANALCNNEDHEVIEQSHTPKVFQCAHEVLDPEKYYWIKRCKK